MRVFCNPVFSTALGPLEIPGLHSSSWEPEPRAGLLSSRTSVTKMSRRTCSVAVGTHASRHFLLPGQPSWFQELPSFPSAACPVRGGIKGVLLLLSSLHLSARHSLSAPIALLISLQAVTVLRLNSSRALCGRSLSLEKKDGANGSWKESYQCYKVQFYF